VKHLLSTTYDRLDIANQKRGDFKETFNMGKFADLEYQQKLPPILTSHWSEIQHFQKECHTVTLKVLTLFALALNVLYDPW
jgi:isopenicillin N synthase-like dioxygenase